MRNEFFNTGELINGILVGSIALFFTVAAFYAIAST